MRLPQDQSTYSTLISNLLDGPKRTQFYTGNEETTAEDYRMRVEAEVARLAVDLGSDRKPVWAGELFGVRRLAVMMRDLLLDKEESGVEWLIMPLREKFEASTGIDCSSIHDRKGQRFRRLSALALIEDFLASPKAEQYQDGVRYFFGHRVPD